jgi:hypothetical protein
MPAQEPLAEPPGDSRPASHLLPDQPAPADLVPLPGRWARLAWYAGTVLLTSLLIYWGLRLDRADLRAPFYYDLDALLILPMVKTTVERGFPGAHWRNDRLGAPGVQELYDFPVIDHLHFAIIWLLGQFVPDVAVLFNLYFLLSFPLAALTAMIVFRHLGLTLPAAAVGGVLFAFLPFHHQRWENHYFLSAYWTVPLSMLPVFAICRGRFPFFRREADGSYRWNLRSWATFWQVALAATTASAGAYYAFFTCVFLAFAGLYAWIAFRTWRALAAAGIAAALVVVFGLVNHLPTYLHRAQAGWNPVVYRGPEECDMYGLKIAHLLLPGEDHGFRPMRQIKAIYNSSNRAVENENTAATLGLVGAAGLVGLVACLVLPFRRPGWPYGPLAVLTVFAILLATLGGFGSVFNLLVTSSIRGYNRISVFIALLCLFASLWAIDRFLLTRTGGARRLRYPAWAAVLALGFLDQTPYSWFREKIVTTLGTQAKRYRADADFFGRVESHMPPGSKIFCLPYMGYPEVPPTYKIAAYEHVRGYIHTSGLIWSFGAMKGREADVWQGEVAAGLRPEMITNMLRRVVARGFDGLFIDGRGFPPLSDPARRVGPGQIIAAINYDYGEELKRLGRPVAPLPQEEQGDKQQFFLDLRPYRDAYRQNHPDAYEALERYEREWVAVVWLEGFASPELPGFTHEYREGPRDALAWFVNPADRPQKFLVTMKLGCTQPGAYQFRISGLGVDDEFVLERTHPEGDTKYVPEPKTYPVTVPPGRHALRFRCTPPPGFISADYRGLCYFIKDFKKTEVP